MDRGVDYKKQGKANRTKGARFELKVRKDLEENYYVVKFFNNIDLEYGSMIAAKSNKFNSRSTGFPDFLVFNNKGFIEFVECKYNGYLSKTEKMKMQALKDMGFNCSIAYNDGGKIRYREFVEYKKLD